MLTREQVAPRIRNLVAAIMELIRNEDMTVAEIAICEILVRLAVVQHEPGNQKAVLETVERSIMLVREFAQDPLALENTPTKQ